VDAHEEPKKMEKKNAKKYTERKIFEKKNRICQIKKVRIRSS